MPGDEVRMFCCCGRRQERTLSKCARSGRAAPELPHPSHLENVTFSRDGRRLVSPVKRGPSAMRVWDAVGGEALTPPLRLSQGAWVCRFRDDGTALIAAGTTSLRWALTEEGHSAASHMQEEEILSAPSEDDVTGQRPIPAEELSEMAARHLKH